MLAPTPLLRRSPMEIGDLFAGTFAVLRKRYLLLLALAAAPMVLVTVGFIVAFATLLPPIIASINQRTPPVGALVMFAAVSVVLGVGSMLLQLKAQAMSTAATYEIAQGQNPTFGSLLTSTRGFLPRFTPLLLLGIAAVAAIYALLIGVMVAVTAAAATSDRSSGSAAGLAVMGMFFLFFIVLTPLAMFITVKLLYVLPVATIEQTGAIATLKRAWTLTTGAFWRTLGYYLLASLAVSAVVTTVSSVAQVAMTPAMISVSSISPSASPEEVLARLASMAPLMIMAILVQVAVQVLVMPLLYVYVAVMYLDQVRRSELPAWQSSAAPAAWTPPAGSWTPPPSPPPAPSSWTPPPAPPDGSGPAPTAP